MEETHKVNDNLMDELLGKLVAEYPNWRITSQITENGGEVYMLEFQDVDGNFQTGLPSDFVSLVAEY